MIQATIKFSCGGCDKSHTSSPQIDPEVELRLTEAALDQEDDRG